MTAWRRCLLVVSLLLGSAVTTAADIENGKQLHDENCLRCHKPVVYTREDRMVNSYEELHERVRQCEIMAEMAWFDEEIDDVVAYLNDAFYQFDIAK